MRILLRRKANGIGDWLFCLAALDHLNRQHPDVEIFVDFAMPADGPRSQRVLPAIVRQAFEASNVDYGDYEPGSDASYRYILEHLVYTHRTDKPFLESTVENLGKAIRRPLVYEPGRYPTFRIDGRTWRQLVINVKGKATTRGKDWPLEYWAVLCELLKDSVRICQVGAGDDPRLSYGAHTLGGSFNDVACELQHALCFAGIENGLAVLAGYLGIPMVLLMPDSHFPARLDFAGQHLYRHGTPVEHIAEVIEQILGPNAPI